MSKKDRQQFRDTLRKEGIMYSNDTVMHVNEPETEDGYVRVRFEACVADKQVEKIIQSEIFKMGSIHPASNSKVDIHIKMYNDD